MLHPQRRRQIQQAQQIILAPLLDGRRRFLAPHPAEETGGTVGLFVQAVVCTQNGQCAEIPSSARPRSAKASLISCGLLNPFPSCSMKLEGCAPAAPLALA